MSYNLELLDEYDQHRHVSCYYDDQTNTRCVISFHRGGIINPCFGATRFWDYKNFDEAINDSLRLSRMMSYKNALAGTKYGGAKAVIISGKKSKKVKDQIFQNYAEYINNLNGTFITGADVGVSRDDVVLLKRASKFFVGIAHDPVEYTVKGLYFALQTTSKEIFGTEDLAGKTFAIQGLGKTGGQLIDLIYDDAAEIYVSDIDPKALAKYSKRKKIKVVDVDSIHAQKVDFFCPCALFGVLNEKSIKDLKCKMIVGCANNQLSSSSIGVKIHQMGILYAPDYLINAGGLISVVDEYEHPNASPARVMKRVEGIKQRLKKVIDLSTSKNIATSIVADQMAEDIITTYR